MIFHPRKWLEPHLVEALDILRFELNSWKGRLLSPKRLNTLGREYLHVGCWETLLDGFLNADFFTNRSADARFDARFPLPFEGSTWRGIYAHHVVEHLAWEDAFKFFRECHRTLKPGGVFRMVVPNLEAFIRLYQECDEQKRATIFKLYPEEAVAPLNLKTPLEMIDYVFRDNIYNRHRSAWDWETAECRLKEAGFPQVVQQRVNQSLDPRLAGHDRAHWEPNSLYVEAVK